MNAELLTKMLDVSRRMSRTRHVEPLLVYALEQSLRLVGAERGFLILIDENQQFDFKVARDIHGDPVSDPTNQISRSILQDAIFNQKPVIEQNALNDPRRGDADSVLTLQLRSVMCVPLITPEAIIGAIYVENREKENKFSEDDLTPLTFFANQAAISIENAMLITELENRVEQRTQQVEQSWRETVEGNRVRTALLGNIAHDMRAPLGVALGSLSMLEHEVLGPLNEEQREWVMKGIVSLRHMKQLSEDLFDLSKIEMDHLQLQHETVTLEPFLRRICEVGTGLDWEKAVELGLDVAVEACPELTLDPVRIQQVLLNLLSNAAKFTHQGTVTLYAHPLKNNDGVLIGVRDTGEGIPADKMTEIFDRFVQFDERPDRRRRGAGLGLAICRELIEMHGGRIWVEANPGGGSNFMFTLYKS